MPDVNTTAARVKAGGGQVRYGPMEVPEGGRILNAMHPQPAAFSQQQAKQA